MEEPDLRNMYKVIWRKFKEGQNNHLGSNQQYEKRIERGGKRTGIKAKIHKYLI